MTDSKRTDPFDALNDVDFDAHVARLLDQPAPSANVSIRMSALLLERLKRAAGRADLPYQTFTKRLLEVALDRLEWADSLRLTAPQDQAEASMWMETQPQRLLTWAVEALAHRLRGRVVEGAASEPVEAVIEVSSNGFRRRAGVVLVKKADDVTLGTFENAFVSSGCELGYVIAFVAPDSGRRTLAVTHHIYYEGVQELMGAVIGRNTN